MHATDALGNAPSMLDAKHGRTDGRTEKHLIQDDECFSSYRVRENRGDLEPPDALAVALGEALDLLLAPRERWPLERSGGGRAYIPKACRRLVIERDGGSCRWCGSQYDPQLDHVIPWSAWGPDSSENLRVLCDICNLARSNFADPTERPQLPVAKFCFWCAVDWWEARGYARSEIYDDEDVPDQIKAYCGACGLTSWVPEESWLL